MSLATSFLSTSTADLMPPQWHEEAACKGLAADIFYPLDDDAVSVAKSVCGECSAQERCLEYALAVREKDGVWGGATERERRSLMRRRRRAAAKVKPAAASDSVAS
jgi:WhiB family transcriptional regulator, redox-sensing transcriptional regulator